MDDALVERVLRAVEAVPSGRVVAYGDIAGLVGTGPRQVGAVMAAHGHAVAWWRVVRADGTLPEHLLDRARVRWRDEAIATNASGTGCRIGRHRADLVHLADRYESSTVDLARPSRPRPPTGGTG